MVSKVDLPARAGTDKALLTIGDLAQRLGVHAGTVRRWEREKVIPSALRRRGKRVYSEQDVYVIEQLVFSRSAGEDIDE